MSQKKEYFHSLEKFIKFNQYGITELYVSSSGNKVSEKQALEFSEVLSHYKSLKHLELFLYNRKIGDVGISYIVTALSNCVLITKLELSLIDNQISDDGALAIGAALSKLKNLTKLDLWLYQNKFGDKGVEEIAAGLRNCLQIKSLSIGLGQNNIFDQGYFKFDQCLSFLPNLFSLYCYLRGSEKLLKSRELINCKNINVLTLSLSSNRSISFQHQVKALKIKRLVKFHVRSHDDFDEYQ
ncbi:hypothetical protein ABPG72_021204 [Tetrahymena utriculariae]